MKYLEELSPGCFFDFKADKFILSSDYKTSGQDKKYKCVSVINGFIRWFKGSEVVERLDLYYQDEDKNLVLVKEHKNEYSENTNIP